MARCIFIRDMLLPKTLKARFQYVKLMLVLSRNFFQGGKIYCYANFFVMLIFLLFLAKFQRGAKVSGGGETASRGRPLPPVEESQNAISDRSGRNQFDSSEFLNNVFSKKKNSLSLPNGREYPI